MVNHRNSQMWMNETKTVAGGESYITQKNSYYTALISGILAFKTNLTFFNPSFPIAGSLSHHTEAFLCLLGDFFHHLMCHILPAMDFPFGQKAYNDPNGDLILIYRAFYPNLPPSQFQTLCSQSSCFSVCEIHFFCCINRFLPYMQSHAQSTAAGFRRQLCRILFWINAENWKKKSLPFFNVVVLFEKTESKVDQRTKDMK